ncbi:MAG TPA: OsmC family protein [Rhodanobacter sp.]|nr:OsmC family protein [Rhodanobacter sp.]
MKIRALVRNSPSDHAVAVATDDVSRDLTIPPRPAGRGSSVNGGELLLAALATCYCNDLFREAGRLGIVLDEVEVAVGADFPGIGLSAANIHYSARIKSDASQDRISELLAVTDKVAEVHNTIRTGTSVTLQEWGTRPDPLDLSD